MKKQASRGFIGSLVALIVVSALPSAVQGTQQQSDHDRHPYNPNQDSDQPLYPSNPIEGYKYGYGMPAPSISPAKPSPVTERTTSSARAKATIPIASDGHPPYSSTTSCNPKYGHGCAVRGATTITTTNYSTANSSVTTTNSSVTTSDSGIITSTKTSSIVTYNMANYSTTTTTTTKCPHFSSNGPILLDATRKVRGPRRGRRRRPSVPSGSGGTSEDHEGGRNDNGTNEATNGIQSPDEIDEQAIP